MHKQEQSTYPTDEKIIERGFKLLSRSDAVLMSLFEKVEAIPDIPFLESTIEELFDLLNLAHAHLGYAQDAFMDVLKEDPSGQKLKQIYDRLEASVVRISAIYHYADAIMLQTQKEVLEKIQGSFTPTPIIDLATSKLKLTARRHDQLKKQTESILKTLGEKSRCHINISGLSYIEEDVCEIISDLGNVGDRLVELHEKMILGAIDPTTSKTMEIVTEIANENEVLKLRVEAAEYTLKNIAQSDLYN